MRIRVLSGPMPRRGSSWEGLGLHPPHLLGLWWRPNKPWIGSCWFSLWRARVICSASGFRPLPTPGPPLSRLYGLGSLPSLDLRVPASSSVLSRTPGLLYHPCSSPENPPPLRGGPHESSPRWDPKMGCGRECNIFPSGS